MYFLYLRVCIGVYIGLETTVSSASFVVVEIRFNLTFLRYRLDHVTQPIFLSDGGSQLY